MKNFIMLESKYISRARSLIFLLIFLPSCKTSNKPLYVSKMQKPSAHNQTYKEEKESIKKKQKLKKQMYAELPRHIKDMNKDELIKAKDYCLEIGYTDLAIKQLERLVIVMEDIHELKKYRLELADSYFQTGEFEKAGKLYSQYLEYYPGSDQREYVEYKAILCRFYTTLQSDRDQTKTKETLTLIQKYLEKADFYTTHIQDVQQIQDEIYAKLIESEMEIIQFYMRRNKYKAAETRLVHIKNNFLNYAQKYEPDILKVEVQLADAQGHTNIAQQKKIELAAHDTKPNIQLTMNAKTDYVSRF